MFSEFLNDRSLAPAQIRFVEMVIEGIFEKLKAVNSGLARG
ncbi:MAG: hypothetical protein MAG794_01634 [Gammaproteobacteria bacterium]|nr:hypothetical protein [Gammaproteobacteria bacterium]